MKDSRSAAAPAVLARMEAVAADSSFSVRERSNCGRLAAFLGTVLGEHAAAVDCTFARNWSLHGKEFRTTWTAGWCADPRGVGARALPARRARTPRTSPCAVRTGGST